METYTLTANEVKLEVFRDLIEELREVRKAQGQDEDSGIGNSNILDTLEIIFEKCFNKTKDSIENG